MNTTNSNNSVPATPTPEVQIDQTVPQSASQNPSSNPLAGMDDNMWATLAHAGTFAGVIIPFGNIIVPLAIMLIKKDESAFITEHARESLNFQISLSIGFIVSAILMLVFIGLLMAGVLGIAWIVLVIKASQAAHKGESYLYPMTMRFIK